MNRFPRGFTLFLIALLSAGIINAQDDSLQSTLEGRYAAMKAAMAAKDGQTISALLAQDFVSVDISGQTEDASQMIKEVLALANDPNKTSKTILLSTQLDANKALVEQRYNMKTRKNGPDGNPRDIELITLSSDVWVRVKGIWVMQRTETKQMDYIVDGKVLIHKVSN